MKYLLNLARETGGEKPPSRIRIPGLQSLPRLVLLVVTASLLYSLILTYRLHRQSIVTQKSLTNATEQIHSLLGGPPPSPASVNRVDSLAEASPPLSEAVEALLAILPEGAWLAGLEWHGDSLSIGIGTPPGAEGLLAITDRIPADLYDDPRWSARFGAPVAASLQAGRETPGGPGFAMLHATLHAPARRGDK